jgi:hypothetical protein
MQSTPRNSVDRYGRAVWAPTLPGRMCGSGTRTRTSSWSTGTWKNYEEETKAKGRRYIVLKRNSWEMKYCYGRADIRVADPFWIRIEYFQKWLEPDVDLKLK